MVALVEWAFENGRVTCSDQSRQIFVLTCPDAETVKMAMLRSDRAGRYGVGAVIVIFMPMARTIFMTVEKAGFPLSLSAT